ncbi:hypothetical protein KP509_24G026100 [Ceratopteris richardii]|uniref:Uncharacterized protein n=1 Tax=Ceratopteris richardii TaxID=49495 RepID=A0A8T2RU14_CERRI|nr:hypothetical protein KP509_24G026100 [Ceratopteris richardii]
MGQASEEAEAVTMIWAAETETEAVEQAAAATNAEGIAPGAGEAELAGQIGEVGSVAQSATWADVTVRTHAGVDFAVQTAEEAIVAIQAEAEVNATRSASAEVDSAIRGTAEAGIRVHQAVVEVDTLTNAAGMVTSYMAECGTFPTSEVDSETHALVGSHIEIEIVDKDVLSVKNGAEVAQAGVNRMGEVHAMEQADDLACETRRNGSASNAGYMADSVEVTAGAESFLQSTEMEVETVADCSEAAKNSDVAADSNEMPHRGELGSVSYRNVQVGSILIPAETDDPTQAVAGVHVDATVSAEAKAMELEGTEQPLAGAAELEHIKEVSCAGMVIDTTSQGDTVNQVDADA